MTEKKQKEKKLTKIPLDENQLKAIRIELEKCKITKDKNDLEEEELSKIIEQEIPRIRIAEEVKKVEDGLKSGKNKDVELSPADIMYNKLLLEKLKKYSELDIPMRDARFKLRDFKKSREAPNSEENLISKYKKILKQGYAEEYKNIEDKQGYLG